MPILHEDEAPGVPAGTKGAIQHLVAPWISDSESLWLGILVLQPGGSTNAHALQGIEGIHYTISGRGKEVLDGQEIETKAGSCLFIAPGVKHQVFNTGDEPLKLLSVTSPPIAKPK